MSNLKVYSIYFAVILSIAFSPPAFGQCSSGMDYGDTDFNSLGYSVATMNDFVSIYYVAGTPFNDNVGSDAGKVILHDDNSLLFQTPLKEVFGEAAGDNFGYSVACSYDITLPGGHNYFFVGAPLNDYGGADGGRAYVFSTESGVTAPVKTFTGGEGYNLGWSVATGDLDNDEHPDFLMGCPGNDYGGTDVGSAFIYWGDCCSYSKYGEAAGDQFGFMVAVVGDVNNDGFNDFAVGAPWHSGSFSDAGRVYIYSGQSPSHSLIRTLDGEAASNRFGSAIAGAGDVNQDGYDDIIVGAYLHTQNETFDGRAYVYSGYNGDILYTFTGENYRDFFGRAVAGGADLNVDGVPDLVVGAERWDIGETNTMEGRVYAYSGTDGSLLWTIEGTEGSHFGYAVSTASHYAGQVFVGAYNYFNDPLLYAGAIFTYSGHGTNPTGDFVGENDAGFGVSLSEAGDVNNDGHDDFIIGSNLYVDPVSGDTTGAAYVYSGVDSTLLYFVQGESNKDYFGREVCGGGDLNGDGYDDFIVGAPFYDGPGNNYGGVYVYSGISGTLLYPPIIGETSGDDFGGAIDIIRDFDGDTYDDIVIGARLNGDVATNAGKVYINSGIDGSGIAYAAGLEANDYFGYSVCVAGDFDGNLTPDFAVGAPHYSSSIDPKGQVCRFDGWNLRSTIRGETNNDGFGQQVSSAGDFNGDGLGDLMVLAPQYEINNGSYDEEVGRVYIFLGNPTLPMEHYAVNADIIITGDIDENVYLESISEIGDFNGDGYDDIIIGTPEWTFEIEGSALIYYGSEGPFPLNLDYTDADSIFIGRENMDEFGQVVSGVGDVDGDGSGDFLVGANYYWGFCQDPGQVYLYLGSASCCNMAGDPNNDGMCNIGDAVYLGNFVFKAEQCIPNPPIGCPPTCQGEGDANADGGVNVGDQVYINNFIFRPGDCITNPPIGCPPECGPGK